MELNRLVFAAPKPSYTIDDLPNLIFIPNEDLSISKLNKLNANSQDFSHRRIRSHEIHLEDLNHTQRGSFLCYSSKATQKKKSSFLKNNENITIPALYLRYSHGSNKIFLYFHANAEDLGMISTYLGYLSQYLKVNVLAIEYPGYGIYKGNPTDDLLNSIAEVAYNYIETKLGFKPTDILIIGRSLGSGPACSLASKKLSAGLILISPFKSIKSVVKSAFGRFASFFIAERFKNIEILHEIKCPIFFIHGKKDRIVSFDHSLDMALVCEKNKQNFDIILSEEAGHNNLHTLSDIGDPIKKFFNKMEIVIKNDIKYIRSLPDEAAWKKINIGEINEKKRKASLLKLLLDKKLKEV